MGFWDSAVAAARPAPAPASAPAPAPATGPWWSSPAYTQGSTPAAAPQAVQQPGQAPVSEGGWGTVEGSKKRAQSAKLDEHCPECGSGDYFQPPGLVNAMKSCQTCGYNTRFDQMARTMGTTAPTDGKPTQPSVQPAGGNFNPGTWIADYEQGRMERVG